VAGLLGCGGEMHSMLQPTAKADVGAQSAGRLELVSATRAASLHGQRSEPVIRRACHDREADRRHPRKRCPPTLRRSSPHTLRGVLIGCTAFDCMAFRRWSFGRRELGPWLAASLIRFMGRLGRYAWRAGQGAREAPEELILCDRMLVALGLASSILFGLASSILFADGIYGAR
jgi:hypothetical protein